MLAAAPQDCFEDIRHPSEARGNGIEKSGKRASNALLYEAFPQAKREEDKVAGELEDVAEDLADVKRKLQNQGNAALAELAKKLRETQQQLPGMGDEQLKEREKSFGTGGRSCGDLALVILLMTIGVILLVLLLLSSRP